LTDADVRSVVGALSKGSFVVRMAGSAEDDVIVAWKGGDTLTTFIPKEMLAVLRKRYGVVAVVKPEADKADKADKADTADKEEVADEPNGDSTGARDTPAVAKAKAATEESTAMDTEGAGAAKAE